MMHAARCSIRSAKSEGGSGRSRGTNIQSLYIIPGTFGGPWVLPRLEDRGQPPFLHQFEAGNVGGSREGSRISPLEPHAGLWGCTLTRLRSHTDCARTTVSDAVVLGRRLTTSHCYQPCVLYGSSPCFPQARLLFSKYTHRNVKMLKWPQ